MESSEVEEPSCWTAVRISDVVEVGQVEHWSESILAPGLPCSSSTTMPARSPAKRKRKKSATPAPAATPKRLFEFDDESNILSKGKGVYFDDPNFECALKGLEKTVASRRNGRSRRAAPVFQSSLR